MEQANGENNKGVKVKGGILCYIMLLWSIHNAKENRGDIFYSDLKSTLEKLKQTSCMDFFQKKSSSVVFAMLILS